MSDVIAVSAAVFRMFGKMLFDLTPRAGETDREFEERLIAHLRSMDAPLKPNQAETNSSSSQSEAT